MPCNSAKVNDKIVEAVDTDKMEGALYQRRCANFIYVVPEGLRELMSDISREVIRAHPKNLNIFIADYLHTLMITRENAKVAMRFVEDVGDTSELLADFMEQTNLTRYQIDKSARIIQRTFRRLVKQRKYENTAVIQEVALDKIMQRLKVTIEEANKAASVIQHAYHLYKLRQERRYRAQEEPALYMPFRHIDWQIAAQRTFDIFKYIRGVRMSEYQKAATLIQAAYRGYYTRKFLKDYWTLLKKEEAKLDTDDDSMKRKKEWAARVLQRFFRNIVKESKKRKTLTFSASTESCTIYPENLKELNQVLGDNTKFLKIEEGETISLHAATSGDFAKMQDKCARIIQRFFRKIVIDNYTTFSYGPYENEDTNFTYNSEEDSYLFEIDTEIENLFEEEDEEDEDHF